MAQVKITGAGVFDGRPPHPYANSDDVIVTASSTLELLGTIINTASITLAGHTHLGVPSDSSLLIDGDVRLQGAGKVFLKANLDPNGDDYRNHNSIPSTGPGAVLRNVDNTIIGGGQLGDGSMTLVNGAAGFIVATQGGAPATLAIAASKVINAGMMEALNGATLGFFSAPVSNTGTIQALGGSHVNLYLGVIGTGGAIVAGGAGSTAFIGNGVSAGTLRSTAGAKIQLLGGTLNGNVSILTGSTVEAMSGVTFDGSAKAFSNAGSVNNLGGLTLKGTIVNSGSIKVGNTLLIGGAATLKGGGTVDGSGVIASGTLRNVDNLIKVDAGGALIFTGAVNNTGSIKALNGSHVSFFGGLTAGGGLIEATGIGATATIVGANLTGGTLHSAGTGSLIGINGGTLASGVNIIAGSQLDLRGNVTFDGRGAGFHSTSAVSVEADAVLTLKGTVVNTNAITLAPVIAGTSAPGQLQIAGDVTLSGHGKVKLGDTSDAGLFGSSSLDGAAAGSVLRNVDNTISGSGLIGGLSNKLTLVNQANGVINANAPTHELTIAAHVINNGLMEATGGGALTLFGLIDNAGGLIQAVNPNSAVTIEGTVNGGTLWSAAGAQLALTGAATLKGGVTIAQGSQVLAAAGTTFDGRGAALHNAASVTAAFLKLQGTIDNTGSITALPGGNLFVDGKVTLQGHGKVNLQSDSAFKAPAFIQNLSGAGTLENVDNTITGSGLIAGDFTLINDTGGVINTNMPTFIFSIPNVASYTIGLYIDTGAHTIVNAGLMEATNHGVLTFASSLKNTGTILAGANSGVIFNVGKTVTNTGSVIEALGANSFAVVQGTLSGGVLKSASGGHLVLSAAGKLTGGLTIAQGSLVSTMDGATFDGQSLALTNAGAVTAYLLKLQGTIVNTGSIAVQGGGHLFVGSAVTLQGHGKVTLNSDPGFKAPAFIQDISPGSVLRNVDNTISGAGMVVGDFTLINQHDGVINANTTSFVFVDPGNPGNPNNQFPLGIYIDTGAHTVSNAGVMEATGGGTLFIKSGVVNTGTIIASNGSTVILGGVINTVGGQIETLGTGRIELLGATFNSGTLHLAVGTTIHAASATLKNVTNTVMLMVDDFSIGNTTFVGNVTLAGNITNSNTIKLAGGIADSLLLDGAVFLGGGGTVSMGGVYIPLASSMFNLPPLIYPSNMIRNANSAASKLVNIDNKISGVGIVGDSNLTLVNEKNGVIAATKDANNHFGALAIDTGTNTIVNDGLLEAVGGATLDIKSSVNNTGTIYAGDASTVYLEGVVNSTVGKIQTSGSGKIDLYHASVTGNLAANIQLFGADTGTLYGTVNNTGTITFLGNIAVGFPSILQIKGDVRLQGHGKLNLVDNPTNDTFFGSNEVHYNYIQGVGPGAVLRNIDNAISGVGAIGPGASNTDGLTLVNAAGGVIDALKAATQSMSLTIDTGMNTVLNAGLMEATGGGLLKIKSAVNNTGGTIEAFTGSTVMVAGVSGNGLIQAHGADAEVEISGAVTGGTLKSDAGGEIALDGGTLTGAVTIAQGTVIEVVTDGTFDGRARVFNNTAAVHVEPNSELTLEGTINNTGSIALNGLLSSSGPPAFPATLLIDGIVTLKGGGSVTLRNDIDGSGNNHQGYNFVEAAGAGASLRNFDNTIAGGGAIGTGDTNLTLINYAGGVIDATFGAPGSGLTIDTGINTIVNAGLMEATGGAMLDIKSAINNTGGSIKAFGGSTVHLDSGVSGGSLVADAGAIAVDGATTGNGKATISNGGSIEFGSAASEKITFSGLGRLLLDASAAFQGDITGLTIGDTIDFGDVAFGAATTLNFVSNMAHSGGVLHVADGAAHADINLIGNYTTSSFAFGDDGGGHTIVSLPSPIVI